MTQSVALACGTAGAYTDVSTYADLDAGVSRSWGRQSEFEDTAPGIFSFTLDNSDGRFNPGSTIYATPVTEGMGVCWQLGTRLVAGTIIGIEPTFPNAESAWAQVTITCDDMLGNAARRDLNEPLASEMVLATNPYLYYPLVDATEWYARGDLSPDPLYDASGVVFGASGPAGDTQVTFTMPASGLFQVLRRYFPTALAPGYPSGSLGVLGAWVTSTADAAWTCEVVWASVSGGLSIGISAGVTKARLINGATSVSTTGVTLSASVPTYVAAVASWIFSAGNYTYTVDLYLNGVLTQTASSAAVATVPPTTIGSAALVLNASATGEFVKFSHFSHTPSLVREERAISGVTESTRIAGIANAVPEITLDTLPAGLSAALLGLGDGDGQSALDALNGVIRAEQGAIYSTTTGTLTAPVEKIKVRERDRVTAVTYSFNAETEAQGATDFIRDITNMAQTVTVGGPTLSATYTDTTLEPRAGSKKITESVAFRDLVDLYTWGTDRIWRGANVALRAASLTVDALNTPTNRTADLLAMVPGDRIQITGLPTALSPTGGSTWDGWLLGVDETHTTFEHTFQMYLQPVLPRPVIYDTDYYTVGNSLTLTSNITNSATSISITSSDGTLFTTGADLPQKIRMESEVMTVTAVSGATSPQTFTVTRGVTDPLTGLATTAAAHNSGTGFELADYGVRGF